MPPALLSSSAYAQNVILERLSAFGEPRALIFAALAAVLCFAIFCIFSMVRVRERLERERGELAQEHTHLRAKLERVEALADVEDQVVVAWDPFEEAPTLRGRLPAASGVPVERGTFLAFGRWMAPESAGPFDGALERLREGGEGFDLTISTRTGTMIETQGRASGSIVFVRFVELTGTHAELSRLQSESARLRTEHDRVIDLLDRSGVAAWLTGEDGGLTLATRGYRRALEIEEIEVGEPSQLLQSADMDGVRKAHESGETTYRGRHPVIWAGERRTMDVIHTHSEQGFAGLAIDRSEWKVAQDELELERRSTLELLDRLASAVVTFDAARHLRFCNDAFLKMWGLRDKQVSGTSNAGLLDLLRTEGHIAEPRDFRAWRDALMEPYGGADAVEDRWQLPDGRTLALVVHPAADGGTTWIFEDISEAFQLRSRHTGLLRVREETLDALEEAVAVFGPDGRLKLSNPAFASLWGLGAVHVVADTPVTTLSEVAVKRLDDVNRRSWEEIAAAVSDHDDERRSRSGELSLTGKEGRTVRWTLAPLPGGQTMATFLDVTDSRRVERALRDRAEALQAAQRTKTRTLRHISRAFREPLTTILGFSDMLRSGMAGEMTERQTGYVGDVATAAGSMHQMVDNILDLATLDAGMAELDPRPTDVETVVEEAETSVADLLRERRLALKVVGTQDVGEMVADPLRLRQILHNLLAHAARHSPSGGTVQLDVKRRRHDVTFTVRDEGPGIVGETIDEIVTRQEATEDGDLGLGLTLVKTLVELHGGTIAHEHDESGTAFHCTLPHEGRVAEAAE